VSACVLGDDCAPQQLLLYAPAALARRLFQHEADAAPCCFLLLTACVLLPAAQPDAVEKWRRHFALDPKRKWRQVQISAGGDGFCLRPHATSLIQIGAANRSAWEGFHRSHRGQNKILKAGRKKKKGSAWQRRLGMHSSSCVVTRPTQVVRQAHCIAHEKEKHHRLHWIKRSARSHTGTEIVPSHMSFCANTRVHMHA